MARWSKASRPVGRIIAKCLWPTPALAQQQKSPVPRDITMSPGQVVEGQMVFHFPITEAQWNGRKGFDVDIRFIHQNDLVLHTGPPQDRAPASSNDLPDSPQRSLEVGDCEEDTSLPARAAAGHGF